ncbi:pathogenicity island-encoded protein D [Photobacterium sp. SKA34]|uniref:C69 family dipeptidase n=1 Tax=Photobacterium sp. SKA34 TaxID=121723 RepID=UPI00006B34AF|nr:C69 family dipeptidase [Photobacterium sp. SKA34]EAR53860.1 pathogenicity island-encoded protein D [Photobacterium sp. SKA34]
MKIKLISILTAACMTSSTFACTTILVGSEASSDGSFIIARNADHSSLVNQHWFYHQPQTNEGGEFKSTGNGFTYALPKNSLGFSSFSKAKTNDKSFGSAGFNELGIGMSATETIYNNPKLLKVDPYNEATGINEDSIVNVILPRIHSAKEGVEVLGKIIEDKGAAEGFGVAFVDRDGIWYLETGSGHQWMATKIENDKYFVSANQGRLQKIDLNDKDNYLSSPYLIKFAQKNGLYDPDKDSEFNFHKIYSVDNVNDITYNYPRVYELQHLYNDQIKTTLDKPLQFPVFKSPSEKLSVNDVKEGLRNHYQGSSHDPYANSNPKELYRPVSVFRAYQSHILQVRPNLPKSIGEVAYIGWGMTDLTPYIAFYQGAKIPAIYKTGVGTKADNISAYWQMRKVQTLAMTNYNEFAPIVKAAYKNFEEKQANLMKDTEKQYLELVKTDPKKAQILLNNFEQQVTQQAMATARELENTLFTKLTYNIDETYHFSGA